MAISDRTGIIASFYKNIKCFDEEKLIDDILEVISLEKIDVIVLGYPKNMNNSEGERANDTILFKEKLACFTDKPIVLQDERLSTRIADAVLVDADMSRKKRKKVIDGVSAVVILQSYLDRKERVL